MAHGITCKNTCGRNNTKTTFLEIFFIRIFGYHFITAGKVSTAISSLNEREAGYTEKHYQKEPNPN